MTQSILAHKVWPYLLALQIVMVLMPAVVVKANAELPETMDNEDDLLLPSDILYSVKRDWQSLHGAWGKRRNWNEVDQMDNDKMAYLDIAKLLPYDLFTYPTAIDSNENIYEDNIYNDKRGWKKMNVAWGKRRNNGFDYAPRASAGGAWGKREPNWNNLKGMWGKRSAQSTWNNLKTGWGKRSAKYPEEN